MQRLELTAPELDSFSYRPGQDIMLLVAADGNRPVRRRYTIRNLDRAQAAGHPGCGPARRRARRAVDPVGPAR